MDTVHSFVPGSSTEGTEWKRGECLGSGTFGTVFKAFSLSQGRTFAVKQLPRRNADDVPTLHEIEILRSLKHPNIVEFLGCEQDDYHFYIFTEYVAGYSITDMMRKYGLSALREQVIRSFTVHILRGLTYLHQNGIVHRDIKGGNILISSEGDVAKLADFGSALGGSNEFSSLVGTPLYMAPEVTQGKYGKEADIWSLGCTILEMLCGKVRWYNDPGSAGSLEEDTMEPQAHLFAVYTGRRHPEIPENISEECADFLHRCFEVDRTKRATSEDLLRHPFLCDQTEEVSQSSGFCWPSKKGTSATVSPSRSPTRELQSPQVGVSPDSSEKSQERHKERSRERRRSRRKENGERSSKSTRERKGISRSSSKHNLQSSDSRQNVDTLIQSLWTPSNSSSSHLDSGSASPYTPQKSPSPKNSEERSSEKAEEPWRSPRPSRRKSSSRSPKHDRDT